MAEREVILVEQDEQINGLVRKLRQSAAHQVTFVAPEEAVVLRSPVNLRLLRFYAEQEGKRLRLVTGDAVVQRLADETGVDWSRPDQARSEPRRGEPGAVEPLPGLEAAVSRPRSDRPTGRQPRILHLLALPALILLLGAWQLWAGPSVTVTVRPALQERSSEVTVRGKVGGRTTPGEVPLTMVQQPVSATATVASTGRRRVGVARARGSVTFLNQEAQTVKVPAGALVTTAAGTAFRVLEAVQVPGVKTEYFMKIAVGLKAGQAEARVEAVEPGTDGNVSAGRVVALKTALPGRLQVTNPEPLRGGEDRTVPVVTAADVGRAEREAAAALARQARTTLAAQLPQAMRLIPDSIRLSPPEVSAVAHPGDEGAEVAASATTTAFALTYRPEVVARAASEVFQRTVPAGWSVIPESVSPASPRFGRVEPQLAEFLVRVTGQVAARLETQVIRQAVRGKTPAAAEAAVRALPGVGEVAIKGAGRRLPSWSGRLRVTVASPAGGAL